MTRPTLACLAALAALSARAQGPLDPSGRLPPVAGPSAPASPVAPPPKKAAPAEPTAGPIPRGAVLEQVNGTVQEVDRKAHKVAVEVAGERVTLSLDRNTMVYTPAGLGTVLDVVPGAQIRAGRNAEFVAYWVQVRPPGTKGVSPPSTPAQGTGPAGGAGAPPEARGGGVAPGGGGTATPVTPGAGSSAVP